LRVEFALEAEFELRANVELELGVGEAGEEKELL